MSKYTITITKGVNKKLQEKIADLEAKLAESDAQEEFLEERISALTSKISEMHKKYRKYKSELKQQLAEKNQDKISFAVEQLDKVRKQFDCEDNYCYGDNNIIICVDKKIFNETIDNQIKQLKEGK